MTSRSILFIASAFTIMTPVTVAAQDTVDRTVTTSGEEEQFPWGLLGLIGLAGLIPRKHKDVHTERTTARP